MKKIAIFAIILFFPSMIYAQHSAKKAEDAFDFAPNIRIREPVGRDLVVVGGTVDISEKVGKDLFALGGTITIASDIDGDVLAAGTKVIISSSIGGNVSILAKKVEILPGAKIAGSVRIRAVEVALDGDIAGDAVIDAEQFEQTGAISGGLQYNKIERQKSSPNALSWFFRLVSLFGMLVIGLLLVNIFPKAMRNSISASMKNPAKDFLCGIIGLVATPLAVIVLMLTIIGFPFALILGAAYLVLLYLAQIFVGIILGTYIFGALKGKDRASRYSLMATMVVGIVVFWLIAGIPSLGAGEADSRGLGFWNFIKNYNWAD